jgi:putative acetyltransferase
MPPLLAFVRGPTVAQWQRPEASMEIAVRPARSSSDVDATRALFRALAKWYLDDFQIDVEFQGFSKEVAGLPGYYQPPRGELLVASDPSGDVIGCIAVRPFDDAICEVKRLYVDPAARGSGAGRTLATEVLRVARGIGYRRAVLDTASFMEAAAKVYESLGFRDIPPYYDNPYSAETERYRVRYLGMEL